VKHRVYSANPDVYISSCLTHGDFAEQYYNSLTVFLCWLFLWIIMKTYPVLIKSFAAQCLITV